jgi:hypothetical protein
MLMSPYRKPAERPVYPVEPWKDPDLGSHGWTTQTHIEYHGSRIACAFCDGVFNWRTNFPVITYARCIACTQRQLSQPYWLRAHLERLFRVFHRKVRPMNYRQQADRPHYTEPLIPDALDYTEEVAREKEALTRIVREHQARAQRWRLFTFVIVAVFTVAVFVFTISTPISKTYCIVPGIWCGSSFLFFRAWYIARPRKQ